MIVDTRYTLSFSRVEVIAALKAHFPNNLHVQAIPGGARDAAGTPTLGVPQADVLSIVWTPLRDAPPPLREV